MKRVHVIFIGLILFFLSCSPMQHIVRNGIEGVILSKKQKSSNFPYDEKDRFKPTLGDIDVFEKMIASIPDLDSLKSSPRQYAGFINEKTGNKCLFVIFIADRNADQWEKYPFEGMDYGWLAVCFDLKTYKLERINM